ncbi:ADP-ribosylglycohydrolase family protein [Comamonas badia]|uniref:ADP-ribosylglycohydrolase family protein n=1 Tax=Comamonas badia TaxID=265291 RepID=UPI0004A2B197|nr:ADP-ribosylglycohydrolase family protein [Comamonas badia]
MNAAVQPSMQSRIQGALMGAFVGDALALGPHWYYDLDEMRRDYGQWVDGYTAPKAGRYHGGLPAGASSQSGFILALTLRSLVEKGGYDEADFCRRMDEELFARMDGTPNSGPGGYTNQSIREGWAGRHAGQPWGQVARLADNTDAAERIIAIAARYASDANQIADHASGNTVLLQRDATVAAMTTAYGIVLGALMAGAPLDGALSGRLVTAARGGQLRFQGPAPSDGKPAVAGQFSTPEPLLVASTAARMAASPHIRVEPASSIAQVHGLQCAAYFLLPSSYYLAARFQGNFEQAVLHAVNGGGQNQSRAVLTGALSGAIGGMEAIPRRFIDGLRQRDEYLALTGKLVQQAVEARA